MITEFLKHHLRYGASFKRYQSLFSKTEKYSSADIIEMQFAQRSISKIILNVVVDSSFSKSDEDLLLKNAREHISNDVSFEVKRVEKIERSKSGKFIPILTIENGKNG